MIALLSTVIAAATCGSNDVNAIAQCSTTFADPVIGALKILIPIGIAIGLVARGVEHKESPKSIAIDVLIGAIAGEIVMIVISMLALGHA